MTRWLLCDYGQVLSLPQPPGTIERLAATAGVSADELQEHYWDHRPAYDRGDLDDAGYWTRTLPAGRDPDHGTISALVAIDTAGWLHPDRDALAAVERARGRGWRTAILSNAPHHNASVIDALDWVAGFAPRIFSCRLGLAKPEPAIYTRAQELLGARADEVTFFDDRPANVEAARAAGWRAHLYTHPSQLDGI